MRAIFALFALLLIAVPLGAQTDATNAASALTGLCPGRTVRLQLGPEGPVQGVCGAVMDGRLVVRQASGDRMVPLAQVSEVWTRGRATETGMWIGAGVGAATLASAAMLVAGALCDAPGCSGDNATAFGFGVVVGAGTGALIGGTIGYLTRRWERRYP